MNKLAPRYLIAVPQLGDPNFARSVVLIVQHSEDGTYGLVINNPTDLSLQAFAKSQQFPCQDSLAPLPVFCGGPVEPARGCILHTNETIEEREEIIPGFFLSNTTESLQALLKAGTPPLRLLLGYAGWAAGQLEMELAQGGWLLTEPNAKYVLRTDPEQVWQQAILDLGIDPTQLVLGGGIH